MKTYLLSLPHSFNSFNEKLDFETSLCRKEWIAFDENGNGDSYIFNKDGSLYITQNGLGSVAKWKYITVNRSLVIEIEKDIYMFKPVFLENNVLVLQLDNTPQFLLLTIVNANTEFKLNSLSDWEKCLSDIKTAKNDSSVDVLSIPPKSDKKTEDKLVQNSWPWDSLKFWVILFCLCLILFLICLVLKFSHPDNKLVVYIMTGSAIIGTISLTNCIGLYWFDD